MTGVRSFIVRVALIATVLAVPVLGTSYALVSQIDRDIALATSEKTTSTDFSRFIVILSTLDTMRVLIEQRQRGMLFVHAAGDVDATLRAAQASYRHVDGVKPNDAFWLRVGNDWYRARRIPTVATIDAVSEDLREAGNELEGDSGLDRDPNVAVLNLADVFLRKAPRSIVALRQTADALALTGTRRMSLPAVEAIARLRARQEQSDTIGFSDVALALDIESRLHASLGQPLRADQLSTRTFERHVDARLKALDANVSRAEDIEPFARSAIAAHYLLWRSTRQSINRLVNERLIAQTLRRRVVIAFAAIAVLLSTLLVTLIGRYEARRDRLELNSAKLEADKLRSEVSRMSAERALRVQEAQFRAIFENAELGIAIFGVDCTLLQHNNAVAKILGDATQPVLAQELHRVARFGGAPQEPFTHIQAFSADASRQQWLALTFSGVYDEGVCQMIILLLRDVTEEKLLEQRLAHEAHHDSLTGLANRAAFEIALKAALCADAERPLSALMYIDLDKFKPINDTFGHRAGDHVLRMVAERIRSVVGAHDLCARLGGDEFAILVYGTLEAPLLAAIAQRIGAVIALPIAYDNDVELLVTASIGVALTTPGTQSSQDITEQADTALYAVKERGRNAYLIHNESLPLLAVQAATSGVV